MGDSEERSRLWLPQFLRAGCGARFSLISSLRELFYGCSFIWFLFLYDKRQLLRDQESISIAFEVKRFAAVDTLMICSQEMADGWLSSAVVAKITFLGNPLSRPTFTNFLFLMAVKRSEKYLK